MTVTRVNVIIAAIMAVVNSVFPALILLNVIHWTSDQTAAVVLVISNTLTLIGLLFASTPVTNTPNA